MQNNFSCHKCGAQSQVGDPICRSCGLRFYYYCPQCRSPISGGDATCGKCGNRLIWPLRSDNRADSYESPAYKSEKQRSGSWLGPLIGLVLVIIIGGAGVYAFVSMSKKPPAPAMTENLTVNKKEKSAAADIQPPIITDIQVSNSSENSVEIHWITDEPSTSQVIWNAQNSAANTTPQKEAMVTQHSVELANLNARMTYYFKVRSVDSSGNEAISGEKSFDIGKQTGLAKVEIWKYSMSIEEKPPPAGVRTYVRGQVKNTGDLPLNIKDIEVAIKVNVPGTTGSSAIIASLDPYPVVVNPGETHAFYSIVPNGTDPNYMISARVLNQ